MFAKRSKSYKNIDEIEGPQSTKKLSIMVSNLHAAPVKVGLSPIKAGNAPVRHKSATIQLASTLRKNTNSMEIEDMATPDLKEVQELTNESVSGNHTSSKKTES